MTRAKTARLGLSTALVLSLSQGGAFARLDVAQRTSRAAVAEAQSEAGANTTMNRGKIESPLACNVAALNAAQRDRIQVLLKLLRQRRRGITALPDGYAIRLSEDASSLRDVGEYIELERRCCPFFDFVLESRPQGGSVLLKVTGRDGVKEFARIEFQIEKIESYVEPRTSTESPLVCNDAALTAEQLDRLVALLKEFRAAKQDSRELPTGYAIRLSASMIQDAAEYMALVRLCSPYFDTALEVQREGGQVWLGITGREGVKALARREFKL